MKEVLIKIGERDYELMKARICKSSSDFIILNGTPLPKGHGRLIDADVVVDGFEDNYELCIAVNSTPTIIEADKAGEEE